MALPLESRVNLVIRLGEYMQSDDPEWLKTKEYASLQNGVFIREFVDFSLNAIRTQLLDRQKLEDWLEGYSVWSHPSSPRKIGLVLPGKLPASGFKDFLCCFLSGHPLFLKSAPKDKVLIPHFIHKLKEWEPELEGQLTEVEMLRGCEAFIATEKENTNGYYERYFGKYPHVIRKKTTGVALLDGGESEKELELLADDIFLYFGKGKRSVNTLFIPYDYPFDTLLRAFSKFRFLKDFHHYKNNYDYQLSLLLLNQERYRSDDLVLLKESEQLFSPVGVLYYAYYEDKERLLHALRKKKQVQAIVGRGLLPFGQSQLPKLEDDDDGVDVMKFLMEL